LIFGPSANTCEVSESERLSDLRALLLDLDGVLYVGDEPVKGAADAVAALRAGGPGLRFVTNTTERSRGQTIAKLRRLGFEVAAEEAVDAVVQLGQVLADVMQFRQRLLIA
jgi:ribonucleotide monophosphatase NagD (HAD superfamily)